MQSPKSMITGGGRPTLVLRLKENPNWYFRLSEGPNGFEDSVTITTEDATHFDKSAADNLLANPAYAKWEAVDVRPLAERFE